MKIALTGATGFTGRRVASALLARGHALRALVRPPLERFRHDGVTPVAGELADRRALAELLAGCEAFVCVAPIITGDVDAVVAAVEASGVRRALFFSSTSRHSRLPTATRAALERAENRIRESPASWTLLRPTMIYGDEGDRNMSRLIRFVSRSPLIPLPGGGQALVQPVHVEDVAEAAALALEADGVVHRDYDLAGGVASPLREVVGLVREEVGSRAPIVSLPVRPIAAACGVWTRLGLPPRVRRDQVLRLTEDRAFSFEPARLAFGFAPRGWREGLKDEVRRLREAGWIS